MKKILGLFLSVLMVFSLAVPAFGAEFADVTSNSEAIETLASLSILEGKGNGFDPDANIKRSEFAAVICRAMNAEAAAAGLASNKFTDVPADHWAAGYIAWAADAEIVNGRGNGIFDPDANITYEEAIKMTVIALGFGPYAENKGGFPTGYLSVANTYDLTSGVKNYSAKAVADRKGIAQIVFNAIYSPLMDTATISFNGDEDYIIYDGSKKADYEKRTLLTQYHDIYKVKAVVTNTYRTDSTLIRKDDRFIELTVSNLYKYPVLDVMEALDLGISFATDYKLTVLVNDDAVLDLIGYTVNAYIYADEDDNKLVGIVPDSKAVDTLVINNPSLRITEFDGLNLKYWADMSDSKVTKVKLAEDLNVFVNGVAYEGDFDPTDYSTITLIGDDDIYHTIKATVYTYGLVDEIDSEYKTILCDNFEINADPEVEDNEDKIYRFYKDGKEIAFDDVNEGDLLNVIGLDTDVIEVYVTNDIIEGYVAFENEDGEYTINGEDYFIAEGAAISSLTAGNAGSFILTIDGYIYDADLTQATAGNFGLILDFAKSDSDFDEDDIWKVKLLDKNNKTSVYDVKSNVRINGEPADLDDQDAFFDDIDALDTRVIEYRISNGVIAEITSVDANDLDGEFKPVSNRLGGRTLLSSAVIFNVPNGDLEKAQVYSVNAFAKDINYTGYIALTDDREIEMAVIDSQMTFVGAEKAFAVVKSVSTGLDAEGYRTDVINFYQAGAMYSVAVNSDADIDFDLAVFDVFHYITNADGEIIDIVKVYDYEDATIGDADGEISYVVGEVQYVTSTYITIDGVDYGWELDKDKTNVLIDTTKKPANAFETKVGTSYIKYTKNDRAGYVVVLKVQDDEVLEVVSYK